MRSTIIPLLAALVIAAVSAHAYPEPLPGTPETAACPQPFPNFAASETADAAVPVDASISTAIWPFGGGDKSTPAFQPKSTRKAFFLSLLLPGLGEWYVGSKRPVLFLGVEAFAWYSYLTNTSKGNDIETRYEAFADRYWHYTDTTTSSGDTLYYNYWNYLKSVFDLSADVKPTDYDKIAEIIINAPVGEGGAHSLPSSKTQQYYEMIGKYDFFVYGWEDIISNNPSLVDQNGNPTYKYDENTLNIKSPLRTQYMSIRGDSNDKLKIAQRGIYIMMINRVLSAIDAGRMAYRHNQNLNSDLSMVRVRIVQKQIIDNEVPMLMVYKPF